MSYTIKRLGMATIPDTRLERLVQLGTAYVSLNRFFRLLQRLLRSAISATCECGSQHLHDLSNTLLGTNLPTNITSSNALWHPKTDITIYIQLSLPDDLLYKGFPRHVIFDVQSLTH